MDLNDPSLKDEEEGAAVLVQRYRDKLEHEETSAIIKIVWSYMVFVSNTGLKDSEAEFKASENRILWDKLVSLLNSKVSDTYSHSETLMI